jgi:hypothetical protein
MVRLIPSADAISVTVVPSGEFCRQPPPVDEQSRSLIAVHLNDGQFAPGRVKKNLLPAPGSHSTPGTTGMALDYGFNSRQTNSGSRDGTVMETREQTENPRVRTRQFRIWNEVTGAVALA